MLDFTDFLDEETDIDRDSGKPLCPRCHLILPVNGECC